jgi:hypothetical protein
MMATITIAGFMPNVIWGFVSRRATYLLGFQRDLRLATAGPEGGELCISSRQTRLVNKRGERKQIGI